MWSKTKIQLESFLCDSLKERVKYISTSYRKTHDYVGRVAIAVDGELDRRIGKRTLMDIKDKMTKENEIVQYFFRLRCEAEGIYL